MIYANACWGTLTPAGPPSQWPKSTASAPPSCDAGSSAGVQEAIAGAGARSAYLPPYSPDLNPIEQVFAKLGRLLQTAAERTIDALWRRIGESVDAFKPEECSNYLRHCGYRYS